MTGLALLAISCQLSAVSFAAEVSSHTLRAIFPPSKDYTVSAPKDWTGSYDWKGMEPGFELREPGGCCTVGLYYFPEGKSEFGSAEAYLSRQRSLMPREEREQRPERLNLSGRTAWRVRLSASLQAPPEKPGPAVTVEQTRVVLQAPKGFYLFMLDSVPGSSAKGEAALQILLDSFKLVKKKT